MKSTIFMMEVIDESILLAEKIIPTGTDKKAAVMTIASRLFDYIVIQAFPIWLQPFSGQIKSFVINILVSYLIDFIVAKYNAGFWNAKQEATTNGETSQTTQATQ